MNSGFFMTQKKIWIISYHFPPHSNVGARRWAKFAKHFFKLGHTVKVFTTDSSSNAFSPWSHDISLGINIYSTPSFYPQILNTHPQTFFEKIHYKLALTFVTFASKGTPYDRALFWKKNLHNLLQNELLKEVPDVIYVNGPPFRSFLYAHEFQKYALQTKIVYDFRDPWSWWFNMGYAYLSLKRKAFEEKLEKKIIESESLIITPSFSIQQTLQKKYPQFQKNIQIISHGYDADELCEKKSYATKPRKFIYFGTLYPGLEKTFKTLFDIFRAYPELSLDIYTPDFKYRLDPDLKNIQFHSPISSKELLKTLPSFDMALLFTFPGIQDFIATKYYEIVASRLPILVLGNAGMASSWVTHNHLGLHFELNEMFEGFHRLTSEKTPFQYNTQFDTTPYDFTNLTQNLIELTFSNPS